MNTILLDGPDGGGKTTLAKELEKLGYRVTHFGVPPSAALLTESSIFDFYFDKYKRPGGLEDPKEVFDRCHLSERIYGPVMRGKTPMTQRAEILLERYLSAVDAQLVICLPPYRVAFNNWVARKGQEYVQDVGKFRRIYESYQRLLINHKRNKNFLQYDYTRYTALSFASSVAALEGRPLPPGVIGAQQPRFLFVGEQPGKDNHGGDYPFMSVNNCSGWFFDRLQEAGYQESEVAFVNVFRIDGTLNHLQFLINVLKVSAVIALGKVAAERLLLLNCQHYAVDHPQFAKRFRAKNLQAYVYALEEIRRKTK